jgi:hypothetical protein
MPLVSLLSLVALHRGQADAEALGNGTLGRARVAGGEDALAQVKGAGQGSRLSCLE